MTTNTLVQKRYQTKWRQTPIYSILSVFLFRCRFPVIFKYRISLAVIVVGDFNLDINKKCNSSKIKSIASHCNMKQLKKDFTRISETTKTIIDMAFVSKPDKVYSSGIHSLGLSDHKAKKNK